MTLKSVFHNPHSASSTKSTNHPPFVRLSSPTPSVNSSPAHSHRVSLHPSHSHSSPLPTGLSTSSLTTSTANIPGVNWFQKIFHLKNGYKKISLPNTSYRKPTQPMLSHYPEFILASSSSTSVAAPPSLPLAPSSKHYQPLDESCSDGGGWWWWTTSSVSTSSSSELDVDRCHNSIQHSVTTPNIASGKNSGGGGGSTGKQSQSYESLSTTGSGYPNPSTSATYRHSHLFQSSLSSMSLYHQSPAASSHYPAIFLLSIVVLALLTPTTSAFTVPVGTVVSAPSTFHRSFTGQQSTAQQQPETTSITTRTSTSTTSAIYPLESKPNNSQRHLHHTHQTTPHNFRCNLTAYPENDGCNPDKSICERQTGNCLCLTAVTGTDLHQTHHRSGGASGNIGHQNQHCLTPVTALGQSCQSSAQCWTTFENSACFAADFVRLQDWRCACSLGFAEKEGICVASTTPNSATSGTKENESNINLVDPQSGTVGNCGQSDTDGILPKGFSGKLGPPKPQLLWIPMLGRCIESDIWYAFRVGRAGGGRSGGGQGGVGGRSTGSRSWFSPNQNGAKKNAASNNNTITASAIYWTLLLTTIVTMLIVHN